MPDTRRIFFRFESSYMGESDYRISNLPDSPRIRWKRLPPDDYERRIWNGTPDSFAREVEAFVGGAAYGYEHWSRPVFEAFVAWLQERYTEDEKRHREFLKRGNFPETGENSLPPLVLPVPVFWSEKEHTWEREPWAEEETR